MAKPNKGSAKKAAVTPRIEGSLLLRSAESIGRIIGSLQRQIDDVDRRLNGGGSRRKSVPSSTKAATGVRAIADRPANSKRRARPVSSPQRSGPRTTTAASTRKARPK